MKDFAVMKTRGFYIAALVTLICSIIGTVLSGFPGFNLVGALVISLLLGMAVQVSQPITKASKADGGVGFISNKFLRLGIILLGFKLNLIDLAKSGVKNLILAVFIVTGTICLTYWFGRKFGVERELAILTASGTAICGAAAIMGISPQINVPKDQEERKKENEVMAVAIICIMGTVFTLLEIAIKPLLHMTPTQFGVMAGGSLHEIAHAVATGSSAGPVSLDAALITKLSRVLMLAPAALFVGIWYHNITAKGMKVSNTETNADDQEMKAAKLPIPWFMAGFLLASCIGTFFHFTPALLALLVKLAYIFLGMAMAALGISVNFKVIFKRGKGAFLACLSSSVVLLCFDIVVSKLFF